MGRKDSIPDDAPAPRLCSLSKWEHFQGYGFNLHSEKGKEGQYIGKIDPASPAEACGLVEGDQIIEVNGVNTSNENHKQVVQRIKADPDKVDLLVVDSAAAEYYKKRGIVVKGSMANVKKMKNGKGASDQDQETGETSSQVSCGDIYLVKLESIRMQSCRSQLGYHLPSRCLSPRTYAFSRIDACPK